MPKPWVRSAFHAAGGVVVVDARRVDAEGAPAGEALVAVGGDGLIVRVPQGLVHLLGASEVGALALGALVGDGDMGGFHTGQDHPETHGQH